MYHFRKTRKKYNKANLDDKNIEGCTLCSDKNAPRYVHVGKTMIVLTNRIPYDIFEGQRVLDHLMVIPKRHICSISLFTDEEKIEYMDIVGDYESKGYNIYARSSNSTVRSVGHQHTHLIKLNGKVSRVTLRVREPYFVLNI